MEVSISSLLTEMNAKDCVDWLKEKSANINREVLQMFIDLMGCSLKLTPSEDGALMDGSQDLLDLAGNVYLSRTNREMQLAGTREFIGILIENISKERALCQYIYTCFDFLVVYIDHEMIPEDCYSVGVALQLMSYHLHPLTSCYLDMKFDPFEEEGILSDAIMTIMQSSFVETYDEGGLSVIDMFQARLKIQKSDHLEKLINRLLEYAQSQQEGSLGTNADEESRLQIYKTKMMKNTVKDWREMISMMREGEEDFLLTLIRTFDELSASEDFMRCFVQRMLHGPKLYAQLFDIISENIDTSRGIAFRAAQLVESEIKKLGANCYTIVSEKLLNRLKTFAKDEQIICSVLTIFTHNEGIKFTAAGNEIGEDLTTLLSDIFMSFNDPILLNKVMVTLVKLGKTIVAKHVATTLITKFDSLYESFLQSEVEKIIRDVEPNDPTTILKMTIMMESKLMDFLDYFQYEAVTVINTRHLNDANDSMFPYARLQKTVLQALKKTIVDNKTKRVGPQVVVPYDLTFIAASVKDLAGKLMNVVYRRDLSLFEAQFVFTCLSQLLHSFEIRPTLVQTKKPKMLFYMVNPRVTVENMEGIVDFVEYYVFRVDSSGSKDCEYQTNILSALLQLVNNYSSLPNLKAFSKIVCHMKADEKFESELKRLLVLLECYTVFPSIIGGAIQELSSEEDVVDFMMVLRDLLEELNDNDGKTSTKWKVCAFLLDNMKSSPWRLDVLEGIRLLSATLDFNALARLRKHVPQDLFADSEQKELEFLSTTINLDEI